jgi:hypothetical protein
LFFAFIGVYLLAVAFSTTDEDLLRERTVAVAQLVMAVPVVFSFAVAPLIFLFLHIHTLIRYDMLAANLRQFEAELESIPREEDRERCRHLLANVEFLRQLGASPGTHLASQVFRFVSWFMIAFFPVMVLLIIQLSALRYQDGGIVFRTEGRPLRRSRLARLVLPPPVADTPGWRYYQPLARPSLRRPFTSALGRTDRRLQPRLHGRAESKGNHCWPAGSRTVCGAGENAAGRAGEK